MHTAHGEDVEQRSIHSPKGSVVGVAVGQQQEEDAMWRMSGDAFLSSLTATVDTLPLLSLVKRDS